MKSAKPTPITSAQNSTQSSRTMSSFDIKSAKPTPSTSAQNSPMSLARICRSPTVNHPDAGARSRFLSMLSFNGNCGETPDATRNPEEPIPPDIRSSSSHVFTIHESTNLRIIFTKISLFCFFTRKEFCIEIKIKVHIFWEGHKILRNLPLTFDYTTYSQ